MCPRIHIEDKHTYNTIDTEQLITSFYQLGNSFTSSPNIIYNFPSYPERGTGESHRIGNKIQTVSIMSEGYIRLDNRQHRSGNTTNASIFTSFWQAFYGKEETYADYPYPGYLASKVNRLSLNLESGSYPYDPLIEDFNISIRHFVVELKDPQRFLDLDEVERNEFLKNWYQYLVIQSTANNDDEGGTGTSNSMQILRESTPYTGQFKILYDKTHHLSRTNQTLHYSYTLPYKRYLNFDGEGEDIPSANLLMELFIPVWQNTIDFGNYAFGMYLRDWLASHGAINSLNVTQGYINSTIKMKYIDL